MARIPVPRALVLSSFLAIFCVGAVAEVQRDVAVDHAEVLVGRVLMETLADGEVIVALDSARGGPEGDDMAEHVFVLQRDTDLSPIVADSFRARLVVRDEGLLVIPIDGGHAWLFAVGEVSDRLAAEAPGAEHVVGFGLAHHRGRYRLAPSSERKLPSRATAFTLDQDWGEPDGTGGSSCQSGGPGSSACSLSCGTQSCSVSCMSGYYACCTCSLLGGPKCRCVKV